MLAINATAFAATSRTFNRALVGISVLAIDIGVFVLDLYYRNRRTSEPPGDSSRT
jgi:hypothetical protein